MNKEIDALFNKLANRIQTYAVKIVDKQGIVAWGKLRRAITTKYYPERKEIDVFVNEDIAPYAQYVHEGRKPGKMPPLGPIEEWVRKKNILKKELLPIRSSPSQKLTSKQQTIAIEAKKTAWAIAMSMKKKEVKPKPFLIEAIIKSLKEL